MKKILLLWLILNFNSNCFCQIRPFVIYSQESDTLIYMYNDSIYSKYKLSHQVKDDLIKCNFYWQLSNKYFDSATDNYGDDKMNNFVELGRLNLKKEREMRLKIQKEIKK